MEQAMHAARIVALHSALLALLVEQQGDSFQHVDGVTVSLRHGPDIEGFDVMYTCNGQTVAGEGM